MANVLSMLVGIILITAVAIPVTISVVGSVNWTGYETAKTIAELLPLFEGIGALVLCAYTVMGNRQ